jgi:hypothetical protein
MRAISLISLWLKKLGGNTEENEPRIGINETDPDIDRSRWG